MGIAGRELRVEKCSRRKYLHPVSVIHVHRTGVEISDVKQGRSGIGGNLHPFVDFPPESFTMTPVAPVFQATIVPSSVAQMNLAGTPADTWKRSSTPELNGVPHDSRRRPACRCRHARARDRDDRGVDGKSLRHRVVVI